MSLQFKTEQDVLDFLGKENYQHLSKKDIFKVISAIPNMDKEVAIKCIEQFPEFTKYASNIVNNLCTIYNTTITESNKDKDIVVETYKTILDELKFELQEENISFEQKQLIIDKMINVSNELANFIKNHTTLLDKIALYASILGGGALLFGGAILGARLLVSDSNEDKEIQKLEDNV